MYLPCRVLKPIGASRLWLPLYGDWRTNAALLPSDLGVQDLGRVILAQPVQQHLIGVLWPFLLYPMATRERVHGKVVDKFL